MVKVMVHENKIVVEDAKALHLCLKVSDCFNAQLLTAEARVLAEYSDYVPDFMPGYHYGDYVIFEIDIDTGMIKNWNKPSSSQLEAFIEKSCIKW